MDTKLKDMPFDINGVQVKVGDYVRGFGVIKFNDGWEVDRNIIVTANMRNNRLYFGGLSYESFDRFEIVNDKCIIKKQYSVRRKAYRVATT